MISSIHFNSDLILFDLEKLHHELGANVFELVNTISTLLRATLYRPENRETRRRSTKLAAVVLPTTDINLIKEVLGTEIHGIYPDGNNVSLEHKIDCIIRIHNNERVVPDFVKKQLRPTRCIKSESILNLTPRQQQVLSLICDRGSSNKQIAKTLKISESTVKLHVTTLLRKFNVKNRTQLVSFKTVGKSLTEV
jgi:DNA-binding NarL/FixJ family response regulator